MDEVNDTGDAIFHRQLDTDRNEAGLQVVGVVAALKEEEPIDLAPIHDTIDHLLGELFSNPPSPASQANVEFLYEGYRINVYQNGKATFVKIPAEMAT